MGLTLHITQLLLQEKPVVISQICDFLETFFFISSAAFGASSDDALISPV